MCIGGLYVLLTTAAVKPALNGRDEPLLFPPDGSSPPRWLRPDKLGLCGHWKYPRGLQTLQTRPWFSESVRRPTSALDCLGHCVAATHCMFWDWDGDTCRLLRTNGGGGQPSTNYGGPRGCTLVYPPIVQICGHEKYDNGNMINGTREHDRGRPEPVRSDIRVTMRPLLCVLCGRGYR